MSVVCVFIGDWLLRSALATFSLALLICVLADSLSDFPEMASATNPIEASLRACVLFFPTLELKALLARGAIDFAAFAAEGKMNDLKKLNRGLKIPPIPAPV